jgi:formylglycine-generating enzyme
VTEMVEIPGGTFAMGSDRHYPEEAPARAVTVAGFRIARHQVTNAEYAAFVAATGYATVAERPLNPEDFPGAPAENLQPGSMVFRRTRGPVDLRHISQWWAWTPGASWAHPEGPASSVDDRDDHPVVHIAFEDAVAYATWAGRRLPTEAEWELAARGGLDGATYVWGEEPERAGQRRANWWHGEFPWRPEPGYGTTTPVGSFAANGFGLFDMAGNVWEWTSDYYAPRHTMDEVAEHPCCAPLNPRVQSPDGSYDLSDSRSAHIPRRVIKGGSHLCAPNYCLRYRPAARQPQMEESSMSHIGFRCIVRPGDAGSPSPA